MSLETPSQSHDFRRLSGRILRAPVKLQTYRNLLYLAVMFPLGVFYFNLLFAGGLAGLGLLVIGIGFFLLLLLLILAIELTRLERALVRGLLSIDIPTPRAETEYGLWTRTKKLVTDRRTWKAVAYLLSEFVYGSIVFGLLSSLLVTAGSFLFAPVYYKQAPVVAFGPIPATDFVGSIPATDFTLNVLFGWDTLLVGLTSTFQIGSWQIETLSGALLIAGLGIILLLISLHLANALAWVWGQYARVMLTTPRYWSTPNW